MEGQRRPKVTGATKEVCPLCGLEVNDLDVHIRADQDLVEIAKLRHPEYAVRDDIHPEVLDHLRKCAVSEFFCSFFTGVKRTFGLG